ncbi:MAG: DUF4870 domain-containing protein [Aquimonas sp.]|nr:DUF4870 domain-containing protein [Aquimonas sp.]
MSENNEVPQNPYTPPAAPAEPSGALTPDSGERQFGLFLHLSALLGFLVPFANLIAPLVMWQIKKNESIFIDDQGKEAVNFQITLTLAAIVLAIVAFPLIFLTLGLATFLIAPLGLALLVAAVVLPIIAGIKANEGVAYRYPLSLRLIK